MQVFKIYPQGFAANSYFLTQDEKTAVVIDPAQPRIADEAKRRGLTVTHVLLTHGHFDHIGGCAALQAEGAKVGCLAKEAPLALGKNNMADYFGGHIPPFSVDFTFGDGDILSLDGMQFLVIATPGHTAGGACFCVGDHLFTGDTLFAHGYGRTDFADGSFHELKESLRALFHLSPRQVAYPGHEEAGTVGHDPAEG